MSRNTNKKLNVESNIGTVKAYNPNLKHSEYLSCFFIILDNIIPAIPK